MVDGAYYSHELSKVAEENDLNLIPTGFENFEICEKKQVVTKCPMGHKPVKSIFKKGVYTAHFAKETCDGAPTVPTVL